MPGEVKKLCRAAKGGTRAGNERHKDVGEPDRAHSGVDGQGGPLEAGDDQDHVEEGEAVAPGQSLHRPIGEGGGASDRAGPLEPVEAERPAFGPASPPASTIGNMTRARNALNIVTGTGLAAGSASMTQLILCEIGRLSQRETSPSLGFPVLRTISHDVGKGSGSASP